MKLLRVDFPNFRSAFENNGGLCSLEVEDDITCLIGTSESGKTNLLEAMAKFETGDFVVEDVPRGVLTGNSVSPPDNLPMISVTYRLDSAELAEAVSLEGIVSGNTIAFQRNYKGPIFLVGALNSKARPATQIGNDIIDAVESLEDAVGRFLRSYSRQRRNDPTRGTPGTRTATIRFRRFLDAVDEDVAWEDQTNELPRLYGRFNSALNALSTSVIERVPARTRDAAYTHILSMQNLLSELTTPIKDQYANLARQRPRFRLVTSEPLQWLRGEYTPGELDGADSESTNPALESARLLLELADLSFTELQQASDYLFTDLLEVGSKTASARLEQYWSQDKIQVRFHMSHRTGNLLIFIESSEHRGLPTQRSYGFRWYLEFLLRYASARQAGDPMVLLFDEPGIHLHPKGQEDLQRLLKKEISQDMQVILTTHLPGMIDTNELDKIRGVVKNERGHPGTWVINEEYSPEHNEITFEVMLRAIGARGTVPLGPGRSVVLEGLSDRQYLIGMARHIANHRDERVIEVATGMVRLYPGRGTKSMIPICSKHIEEEVTFCILLDDDEAGRAKKKSLEKDFSPPNELFRGVVLLTDLFHDMGFPESGEYEIEDIFGAEFYSQMINAAFSTEASEFQLFEVSAGTSVKSAAETWLVKTGRDADDIYIVSNKFSDMLDQRIVDPPEDVVERFAMLIEHISNTARPPE